MVLRDLEETGRRRKSATPDQQPAVGWLLQKAPNRLAERGSELPRQGDLMLLKTASQIGARIGALYARLIYHLEQIVLISREIKTLKKDWTGAPVLIVREGTKDGHSDLLVTRMTNDRWISTGFNVDERLDATLVYVERLEEWGEEHVTGFDRTAHSQSADDHPYSTAAKYFKANFEPNPDASSLKDMESRYRKTFELGDIFFAGCQLAHFQTKTVKVFRNWLQGLPARSPLGRRLPALPLKKANSEGEAAQKAGILRDALDFYGSRKGNGWISRVKFKIASPVNREFHNRVALFRILWVLNFNKRFGYKIPDGDPNMRWCPFEDEVFENVDFMPKHEKAKINAKNDNARHMLGRLIQLRYHLSSRSIDTHVLCHDETKEHGYVKLIETHPLNPLDPTRGIVFRDPQISTNGKKIVTDAALPGKIASIINSWRRGEAEAAMLEDYRSRGVPLHMVRKLDGEPNKGYWREVWNAVQQFAKVEVKKLHTLKKSGITDAFYGGHSLEDLEEFSGTSRSTLKRSYRLITSGREYKGPAWTLGPGVPPWYRAKRRAEAREQNLPYPF